MTEALEMMLRSHKAINKPDNFAYYQLRKMAYATLEIGGIVQLVQDKDGTRIEIQHPKRRKVTKTKQGVNDDKVG